MTAGTPLRVLLLAPFVPDPDGDHGGARATGQLLATLASRHAVTVLCLRASGERSMRADLRGRCAGVEEVPCPHGWRLEAAALAGLRHGTPLWVTRCAARAFTERVRALSGSWRPDIIQVEFAVMAQHVAALEGCPAPRILVAHEPGAAAARDRWLLARGPVRGVRALDLWAWRRFERRALASVDAVVTFTEADRAALAPVAGSTPVVPIPLGAPVPPRALDPVGAEPPTILFVGNFVHPPNVDAAARLVRDIFPRVHARAPGAVLWLVGDRLPAAIRRAAGPGIVVTGRVADVTPLLDRAAIVVAPLRLGGGMRLKVIEALAAGKAVVASRRAIAGLGLTDGREARLAEGDAEFAEAILALLHDPERRRAIAGAARSWVAERLDWERTVQAYEDLYARLLAAGPPARRERPARRP